MTSESFKKNFYSDSICLDNKKNKIRLRSFYNVFVILNRHKTKYKAGSIYGFFDGSNKYRYAADRGVLKFNGYFKLLDDNGLIIYSYHNSGHTTFYFYSKDTDSAIKSLTAKNIEFDFQNIDFITEVKNLKDITKKVDDTFLINNIYNKYYP